MERVLGGNLTSILFEEAVLLTSFNFQIETVHESQ